MAIDIGNPNIVTELTWFRLCSIVVITFRRRSTMQQCHQDFLDGDGDGGDSDDNVRLMMNAGNGGEV